MRKDAAITPSQIHTIEGKGIRVHNLKNINVSIPHNKFVVITGVSGSGKSSLAFDTLYAEGQRRYVESLSAYARQFLGKMNKPDADSLTGLSPAIAIEQRVISRSSRSTVGTSTEIYDYLKLLFARIGRTYSPISGKEVKRESVNDVIEYIKEQGDSTVTVLAPKHSSFDMGKDLEVLRSQGFSRIEYEGEFVKIDELADSLKSQKKNKTRKEQSPYSLLVDRIIITKNADAETLSRAADSVQTAYYEGKGECVIVAEKNGKSERRHFSNRFEEDGIEFTEPSVHFFSFNNPVGACRRCEGFGSIIGLDEKLIIPNRELSVYEGAIACWKGEKMGKWLEALVKSADKFDFPVHRPFKDLSAAQKELLWAGNEYFDGLTAFFEFVESESYKIQYRVMLARYRGKTPCPDCKGSRLRKDTQYVKIGSKNIGELSAMQIKDLAVFFNNLSLSKSDADISKRILIEIRSRIKFLIDVGLGYLTLSRMSNTLSGGESQRINLATSLGSSLVGSTYILDEPSIGLHPRDTQRLISVLKALKQIGNTVLVVEHDEEIMRAADLIIDLGPYAGIHGGEVVFQGNAGQLGDNKHKSLTLDYLQGVKKIETPLRRKRWKNYIEIIGASENNLKNVNVKFPLKCFTAVAGVSGSGKTTLVKKILCNGLKRHLGGHSEEAGSFSGFSGDMDHITNVEMVDQNPIGKSSRSNPVTYLKAYDDIRQLYASSPLAKMRGYKPAFFSFNVDGGRCDVCEGEGSVTISMQFMADVKLECEACKGKRFKEDVLEITYRDKNISDLLNLSVDEATAFFEQGVTDENRTLLTKLLSKLKILQDVGMGYVKLGQPSGTLSGGEAQRIKLAYFLSGQGQMERGKTMYIFDEPTTGLHFNDIKKLLGAFNRLVEEGNTLIVIEHNPDVIKCADHVIELGPEGGDEGGMIVFEGSPDRLVRDGNSLTGKFLASKFS